MLWWNGRQHLMFSLVKIFWDSTEICFIFLRLCTFFLLMDENLLILQTWPTEEELMEASNDEKTRLSKKKKKLLVPCGTSDYQVLNPPYPICSLCLAIVYSFVFCAQLETLIHDLAYRVVVITTVLKVLSDRETLCFLN